MPVTSRVLMKVQVTSAPTTSEPLTLPLRKSVATVGVADTSVLPVAPSMLSTHRMPP